MSPTGGTEVVQKQAAFEGHQEVDDSAPDTHSSELKALARRVALAALDDELFPDVTHPKKRAFLIALAETGNRSHAARAAGISRSLIYTPTWRDDEAFQEGLRQAQEAGADLLEAEAYRRAVEGVQKPVGWYKGEPGGYVTEYSDTLLIFLLKGARPEKYRERMEIRGALANLDVTQLPDELLQRIIDGEHPASVLGSALVKGRLPDDVLSKLPPNGREQDV